MWKIVAKERRKGPPGVKGDSLYKKLEGALGRGLPGGKIAGGGRNAASSRR